MDIVGRQIPSQAVPCREDVERGQQHERPCQHRRPPRSARRPALRGAVQDRARFGRQVQQHTKCAGHARPQEEAIPSGIEGRESSGGRGRQCGPGPADRQEDSLTSVDCHGWTRSPDGRLPGAL